jgi:hypothetical protein
MYAGEGGKGLTMLLTGVGALVLGYSASNCDAYGCEDTGPLAAGYVVAVGMWVYSLVDAHNAAARHNALAPRNADLHVVPLVARGSGGGANVGLSFRY